MSNLAYLLAALGVSVLGSVFLWYRHRRPRSMESGVDAFKRELNAIAPDRQERD